MNKTEGSRRKAMKIKLLRMMVMATIAGLSLVGGVSAQEISAHHHMDAGNSENANPETIQDWAKDRLTKSPRHREWVTVKNGNREVNAFVVYPQVSKKATAVVVIHEIFGMSDWVQQLTDELAEAGYIAIAPDLLSGMGPKGGGSSDVATKGANAIGAAIRELKPDQLASDLNAVADYVSKLPAANGKV